MAKFSKNDYKYFELARKAAMNSTYDGFKLGCVMVYKGHVIATGHNSDKTSPMQKKYNQKYRQFKYSGKPIRHSKHAEIAALSSIPYPLDQQIDYSRVRVYVFRIAPGLRLGQGISRPCAACTAALRDKGIRDIYYTTDDGFAHERLF
jgi:deoxycytidylate deaminase